MRKFRMYLILLHQTKRSVDFPEEYTEEQILRNIDNRKCCRYEIRELVTEERVVKVETVRRLV